MGRTGDRGGAAENQIQPGLVIWAAGRRRWPAGVGSGNELAGGGGRADGREDAVGGPVVAWRRQYDGGRLVYAIVCMHIKLLKYRSPISISGHPRAHATDTLGVCSLLPVSPDDIV